MFATIRLATALYVLIATGNTSAEAGVLGAVGDAAESTWKSLPDILGSPPVPHVPPSPAVLPRPSVPVVPSEFSDLPNPYRYGQPPAPAIQSLPAALRPEPHQTEGRVNLSWKIAAAFSTPPRLIIAKSRAVAFGKEFSKGAHSSEKYLGELGKMNSLVASWLDAPVGLRVFVVGAAESDPDVKQFRDRLKALGYQVFFYKFCKDLTGRLCASEAVGAFYATAGHAVAFRSADFDKSPYIDIEVATIYQHSKGGILLVFTPQQAAFAGLPTAAATVAATCFNLAQSGERHKMASDATLQKPSKGAGVAPSQQRKGGCPEPFSRRDVTYN